MRRSRKETQFIANMDELLVGWVRWSQNKPTDHIMGKVVHGYQPPRRNELGDNDQDQWEVGDDGNSRDPWQLTNYLLLQGTEEELYTFTTSSKGGINAVGDLCVKYGKQLRQHPNDYPVIKIGTGSYMHQNKSYGRIKYPMFEIVGWVKKSAFVETAGDERTPGEVDEVDVVTTPRHAGEPSRKKRSKPRRSSLLPQSPPRRSRLRRQKPSRASNNNKNVPARRHASSGFTVGG